MQLKPGDQVKVKGLGSAIIIKLDPTKALVKLQSGLQLSVPLERIQSNSDNGVSGEQPASATAIPISVAPIAPQSMEVLNRFRKLLAEESDEFGVKPAEGAQPTSFSRNAAVLKDIESLRYGVVPLGSIEKLTRGFDQIENWTRSRLPDQVGPTVSEVCGAFGTGKSHSMSLIRHIARKRGYLTARVEIDSSEVTLANPEGLLKALWPSLSGKDFEETYPLIELCIRSLSKSENGPRLNTSIERTFDNYRTVRILHGRDTLDEVIDELDGLMTCSGEFTATEVKTLIKSGKLAGAMEVELHPPLGRSTTTKSSEFMETLIAYSMLAEKAGYRGLVITVDEFEITRHQTQLDVRKCVDLLTALTKYFEKKSQYPKAPLAIFFATVADADALGDKLIEEIIRNDSSARYTLKQLDETEILQLAEKIFQLYVEGYALECKFDSKLAKSTIDHVYSSSASGLSVIREFIKTWIFTLDSMYGPKAN